MTSEQLQRAVLVTDFDLEDIMNGISLVRAISDAQINIPTLIRSQDFRSALKTIKLMSETGELDSYVSKDIEDLDDVLPGISKAIQNFDAKMVAKQAPDASAVKNTVTIATKGKNDSPNYTEITLVIPA